MFEAVGLVQDHVMSARTLSWLLLGSDHGIDSKLPGIGQNVVRRKKNCGMAHRIPFVGA